MTTSGVTAWSLTARDIAKLAMGEIAGIELGAEPDGDEAAAIYQRLNGMLKSWQLRGVSLFRETTDEAVTAPATATVTLPAEIRDLSSVRLVVSSTMERPLFAMSRADYLALPNKASAGQPTIYYLDRQRDAAVLRLWPISATAATIRFSYDRVGETVTDGSETLDIREELQETVYANLAVRIAGLFGQSPSPELASRAASLEAQMFDAERPDSYFFRPEHA